MNEPYRLAVIPARGGSKGIPQKNIRLLCGKPLIAWSIESALAVPTIHRVVVSTDNAEIADVATSWGAEILWRPAELATDEATTISVMTHVATEVPKADIFMVLQPTSPLRPLGFIDECIRVFEGGDFDNLATGYYCKYREYGTHNNHRRQDYRGFFYDDGSVYLLRRPLVERGQWFGDHMARHESPRHLNYEIDDEVDMVILDALMKAYQLPAIEDGLKGI
jgi:CMP-N-acetylneuraminic acid synthetase